MHKQTRRSLILALAAIIREIARPKPRPTIFSLEYRRSFTAFTFHGIDSDLHRQYVNGKMGTFDLV